MLGLKEGPCVSALENTGVGTDDGDSDGEDVGEVEPRQRFAIIWVGCACFPVWMKYQSIRSGVWEFGERGLVWIFFNLSWGRGLSERGEIKRGTRGAQEPGKWPTH